MKIYEHLLLTFEPWLLDGNLLLLRAKIHRNEFKKNCHHWRLRSGETGPV